MITILMIL